MLPAPRANVEWMRVAQGSRTLRPPLTKGNEWILKTSSLYITVRKSPLAPLLQSGEEKALYS